MNQCILVPKSPSVAFLEQRVNAVIALKHALNLVNPLRAVLAEAENPLMKSLYMVLV